MGMLIRAAWASCVALGLATAAAAADLPPVKTAELREPILLPADGRTPTLYYRKFLVRLPGDKVGVAQAAGLFGCGSSVVDVRASTELNGAVNREVGRALRRELEAAHYTRAVAGDSAFSTTPAGPIPSDYDIGVTLKDLQLSTCSRDKLVIEGGAWIQLRWELFATRQQKVVLEATTEGASTLAAGEKLPLYELLQKAVTQAVRQLLADQRLVDQMQQPLGDAPRPDSLRIALRAAADGAPAQDRMAEMQSAVATLLSGSASGSGFYISKDGYLLTNQHVVGDAKFIKVKLANGRELVGDVLRSDRKRDVALVKTEAVSLAPFRIAGAEPQVGEDVYVLGSPLGEALAQTVTRGVLSAAREVEKQRWLQSDARILPGSSGGPMVGKDGGVVGITASGIGGGLAGVGFFVPIGEALGVLRIDYAGN